MDDSLREFSRLVNAFCPTGEGGGIDPTCSPTKSSGKASSKDTVKSITKELTEFKHGSAQTHMAGIKNLSERLSSFTVKDLNKISKAVIGVDPSWVSKKSEKVRYITEWFNNLTRSAVMADFDLTGGRRQ